MLKPPSQATQVHGASASDAEQHERPAVLRHVAANLRQLRQARGLSQDALATRAGISRRMLVSVEGGDSNVSLATLDRLAEALGVHFADLVLEAAPRPEARTPALAWRGASTESRALLLQSLPARHSVELWEWVLAPGEVYAPEPDPAGWREIVYVLDGTLTLTVAGQRRVVGAGGVASYGADTGYRYENAGPGALRFIRNVVV